MSHYYVNDETLKHNVQQIEVKINQQTLKLNTDAGVFSKSGLDFGTRVLLENIQLDASPKTMIDMGCGYGPIGLYLAKAYPNAHVLMVDVNDRALDLARQNQALNQVKNVDIMHGFLFENIHESVDVIVTNPPIRAGKQVIFSLYEGAQKWLKSGGFLYVVINKKHGAPSTLSKLSTLFENVEILEKSKGYWILLAKKA